MMVVVVVVVMMRRRRRRRGRRGRMVYSEEEEEGEEEEKDDDDDDDDDGGDDDDDDDHDNDPWQVLPVHDFYRRLKARDIFLTVPDPYWLAAGTNKEPMVRYATHRPLMACHLCLRHQVFRPAELGGRRVDCL
jgi:hypothetical protein